MCVTIHCDGRIEVKVNPGAFDRLILVYKHISVTCYDTDKCEIDMSCSVGGHKPVYSLGVSKRKKDGGYGTAVSFDFPFELRKVANETFEELVEVMNRLGMVDLSSQLEE